MRQRPPRSGSRPSGAPNEPRTSWRVAGESLYLRREVIPIHDIEVTFHNRTLHRFLLVPGKTNLESRSTGEGVAVTVPRLDIHCMVVAEK